MEIQECTSTKKTAPDLVKSNLTSLPPYLFGLVLSFLDWPAVLELRRVSRSFKQKIARYEGWCGLLITKFLPALDQTTYAGQPDLLSEGYSNSLLNPQLTHLRNKHSVVWHAHFRSAVGLLRDSHKDPDFSSILATLSGVCLKLLKGIFAVTVQKATCRD